MIIELAGIPGCGKTTYAKQILRERDDCVIVDNACLENSKSVVPLLRHFGFLYAQLSLKLCLCCGFSQNTLHQIKCLGRNLQKYIYAQEYGTTQGKVVLIDEGFVAPIVSIVDQSQIPAVWQIVENSKQFRKKFPQVRVGIIAADAGICAERILSRTQSLPYTLRNLDHEGMTKTLKTMTERLNCLRNCFSDRFPAHDIPL